MISFSMIPPPYTSYLQLFELPSVNSGKNNAIRSTKHASVHRPITMFKTCYRFV